MTKYSNIYDYVKAQITAYTLPIDINGWQWSMKDHIKKSFFYHHSLILNGKDETVAIKNITRPLLNLQFRAEDIDLKNILIYVDDEEDYHLSFLIKKYHDDVFSVKNNIDEFLDEVKESKVVYGAGIAKKNLLSAKPEVVPLESVAFCDQTSILGGVIGFQHNLNPYDLKQMEESGWGDEKNGATISIDELLTLAEEQKVLDSSTGVVIPTTTKNISVYEIHGCLPSFPGESYKEYDYQLAIIAFYHDKSGDEHGVTLFRKKQNKGNLKVLLRDKVYSRACGFGGAEELFDQQIWSNYSVQRQKDLLEATSKVLLATTDSTFVSKHPTGLKNLENLEVLELMENTTLSQVDTSPRSMVLFDKFEQGMKEHAQLMSGATDALLGNNPTSGTPFKLQDLVTTEGKGLHDYRRKKFAKFIEEVYMDWIIPHIKDEITNGVKFLSELSVDELRYVGDCLVRNKVNEFKKEKILNGELVDDQEVESFKQKVLNEFMRGGNKKFIQALKGEFNNKKISVKVNVDGAQKDLNKLTDKLVNIFRQIIANPQGFQQVIQMPGMQKVWNEILEYSGLTPGDFAQSPQITQQLQQPTQPAPQMAQ